MGKGPERDFALERRWRGLVEDQSRSGLSVQAFCDQRNISPSSFHHWKRELKRRDGERPTDIVCRQKSRASVDFIPVTITTMAEIEIDLAGAIIRVQRGFDEEALARVVHILRCDHSATGEADRC